MPNHAQTAICAKPGTSASVAGMSQLNIWSVSFGVPSEKVHHLLSIYLRSEVGHSSSSSGSEAGWMHLNILLMAEIQLHPKHARTS